MKYFSEIEGYEDCFVDVVDKWTMKELKELTESDDEQYFEIFRRKVTSLLLRDADGVELRDITQFNAEFVENLDVAMAGFNVEYTDRDYFGVVWRQGFDGGYRGGG